MSGTKDIDYRKKFKFDSGKSDYEFRLTKRRWWWLLLLLLPLLLVKCTRTIDVVTMDAEENVPLPGMGVSLSYTSHTMFHMEDVTVDMLTDSTGTASFRKLPCSVFSYIFNAGSRAEVSCCGQCFEDNTMNPLFHFTRKVEMSLEPKRSDITVTVLDLETDDPLAGATVRYSYFRKGEELTDSLRTDPAGRAVIPSFRYCRLIDTLKGACFGYSDTCRFDLDASALADDPGEATIRLRPLKQSFTFFVKNVETREPIPGAHAEITLTDPHRGTIRASAVTNVDGKGRGGYKDGFVLADLTIKASRQHFHDSTLAGYNVMQFCALSDDGRTVWLRPEPFVVYYEDRDTVTRETIAGVSNSITVTDPSGNKTSYVEMSNRNGKFPVKAKENSRIDILSVKKPEYEDKASIFPRFGKKETVWMQPARTNLLFRTIEATSGEELGNCTLEVRTTCSGVTEPTNSGSGVFMVEGVYYTEKISITASKKGYTTNSTKIRNSSVGTLSLAGQNARDIPLKIDLPPCNANVHPTRGQGQPLYNVQSYNMGQKSGTFRLWVDAYSEADRFIVYDGDDTGCRVLFAGVIQDKKEMFLTFTNYVVTVAVETHSDGSAWEYIPHCP